MSEPRKRGRPRKEEDDALKALEYVYILVHLADFIMDKNSPQIMEMMESALLRHDYLQASIADAYLARRHKAIDHLLATAKPKERERSRDERACCVELQRLGT